MTAHVSVRRRIVMALMLVGSAGVVGAVASLMVSFTGAHGGQTLARALVLPGGCSSSGC